MPTALVLHPAGHFTFPEVPDGGHSARLIGTLLGTLVMCGDQCPRTGLLLFRDGWAEEAETPLNPRATKHVRAAFRKRITVYGPLLVIGGSPIVVKGLTPQQVDTAMTELFRTTLADEQKAGAPREQGGTP